MISFGAPKPKVDLGATERIKGWASAAARAHGVASLSAGVTVMVAEVECREEGCPPVETVISFLEKANPQKVKVEKRVAAVTETDVLTAVAGLLLDEPRAKRARPGPAPTAAGCCAPAPPQPAARLSNAQPLAPGAEPLPFCTDVLGGRLANGLTYYIRQNREPRGRAELRLVVRVGSLSEGEDSPAGR
jgi:hypothetical protein